MNDRDYELLSAYIDGALNQAERAALEKRLATETDLRGELQSLRQTVALVRQIPNVRAPRDFTLTPQLVGPRAPSRSTLPFPLTATFSVMSAAAAVLFFIFGGYFLLRMNTLPMTPSTTAFQSQTTGMLAEVESTEPAVVALALTASPVPTMTTLLNTAPPAEARSADAEALPQGTLEQVQVFGEGAPAASAPAQANAQEEAEDDGAVLLYRGTEEPLAPAPEVAANSALMDEAASQGAESPATVAQDAADTGGSGPGSGVAGAAASEVSKAAPTSLAVLPTAQPNLALRAENTLEIPGTAVADEVLREVDTDTLRERQALNPAQSPDLLGWALLAVGIGLLGTAATTTYFRHRRLHS